MLEYFTTSLKMCEKKNHNSKIVISIFVELFVNFLYIFLHMKMIYISKSIILETLFIFKIISNLSIIKLNIIYLDNDSTIINDLNLFPFYYIYAFQ